ncbi:MAG TPA: hypothetical protein VGF47_01285 [Solirubrobacteraceae bacterium]|jgi:hypothetical protein
MGGGRAVGVRLAALALSATLSFAVPAAADRAASAGAPAPAPSPAVAHTPTTQPACGAHAPEELATTAGTVAERIYAAEVHSSETDSDKRQIETYAPLLSAVESGNKAAIETAVHSLVYSHTHIVRLRVDRGSELVSDIGGPYILAPITGRLRSHGKEIGHFVFSVQDDLGYVKLETRFIGAPLVLRTESGQVPVEGLLSPGPTSIPDHGPVAYRGATYEAYSFNAGAYPSGRLRVSLLLPVSSALATQSCDQIKAAELGLVARLISRRFTLSQSSYASYIRLTNTLTHALVYVRSGSRTVAGSTPSAPPKLPEAGPLRYHGADYEVSSFSTSASGGSVRVYVLAAH